MALYADGHVKKLVELAKGDNLCAMHFLAQHYAKRPASNEQLHLAYQLQLKAAESGLVLAQRELGRDTGGQVYPLKFDEALKWLDLAARAGNTSAQVQLAKLIIRESLPSYPKDEGFRWLNAACLRSSVSVEEIEETLKNQPPAIKDKGRKVLAHCIDKQA